MAEDAIRESYARLEEPEWLGHFLQSSFFGSSCPQHPIRGNEMKRYCIDCKTAGCQYCISSGAHRHHKILKLYRHVYTDSVCSATIGNYIDCSGIQKYKSNSKLVIALVPLPHCGAVVEGKACEICSRRITEPQLYTYCSISCKVLAFLAKSDDSRPPFLSLGAAAPTPALGEGSTSNYQSKRRERKGKPCRAPFF